MKLRFATLTQSMLAAVATLALGASSAHAHPGHGMHEASAVHILSSPYHLALLAVSGAVLMIAGRVVQRRLPRRVLQDTGLAALATATLVGALHI